MNKELIDYVQNTNSDMANFNLALWYENQKHSSPACSYYLKCAEITKDKNLAYECLLRLYSCYHNLSNRDYTCENLLKSAINLKPKAPEAYFLLSQFFERKKNWMDGYLYASIGLEVTDCVPSNLITNLGYSSKYMLVFQKAVCSWWYGKPKESRKLFRKLKDEYGDQLDEYYLKLVENNLISLGSGSVDESSVTYSNNSDFDLVFKFDGSDRVQRNFSQVYQDLFVLAALDGKKNGTYLEIGSAHSFHNSNTALLEKEFGWTGVGIEMKRELVNMHETERKNKVLCENALKINYEELLNNNFSNDIIDYLQIDIEPCKNTIEAVLLIPFDKYKFRVITYEHDHYVDITRSFRDKSRRYLNSMGYTLIFNDISPHEDCSFEDWWVHKDLIDHSIFQNLISVPKGEINLARDMMLKKKITN